MAGRFIPTNGTVFACVMDEDGLLVAKFARDIFPDADERVRSLCDELNTPAPIDSAPTDTYAYDNYVEERYERFAPRVTEVVTEPGKIVRHACEPPTNKNLGSYFFGEAIYDTNTVWECDCGKQWIVKASHIELRRYWRPKWFRVRNTAIKKDK